MKTFGKQMVRSTFYILTVLKSAASVYNERSAVGGGGGEPLGGRGTILKKVTTNYFLYFEAILKQAGVILHN